MVKYYNHVGKLKNEVDVLLSLLIKWMPGIYPRGIRWLIVDWVFENNNNELEKKRGVYLDASMHIPSLMPISL